MASPLEAGERPGVSASQSPAADRRGGGSIPVMARPACGPVVGGRFLAAAKTKLLAGLIVKQALDTGQRLEVAESFRRKPSHRCLCSVATALLDLEGGAVARPQQSWSPYASTCCPPHDTW